LSIRSRRFVVDSVVIEDEPRTADDGTIVFDVPDEWLRRAVDYVAQFEQTFAAVIWRERYEQEDRVRRRFGASGATTSILAGRRRLDSELLFVWLAKDVSWIAVRDVIALDGTPRPADERRLEGLLSGPAMSVAQLKQLAAQNGRFNIGQIVRTFNEPTLALLFLDDHYRDRFKFARTGEQKINGQDAVIFEFVEVGRPTVIKAHDRDLPVRGTLAVDGTGRVLHTSMELSEPRDGLSGRMTVSYGPNPKFDVLVPMEMRETYASRLGEEVTTVATYADFRRFETTGRVILPK